MTDFCNEPNETRTVDHSVFRTVSLETLEHLSRFKGSVPGMAQYIAERTAEIELLTQAPSKPDTTDTIRISADGSLLHL